jgi:hypothetical protein
LSSFHGMKVRQLRALARGSCGMAGTYATQNEAVRTILKLEGPLGFYKGFLSTVLREVRHRRRAKWGVRAMCQDVMGASCLVGC